MTEGSERDSAQCDRNGCGVDRATMQTREEGGFNLMSTLIKELFEVKMGRVGIANEVPLA
jgi:hypothetical protein